MNRSEQTRALLQAVAIQLFEERGFDEVTVEEIARQAGVSHMTFYRHFATKESVVFDDPFDPVIGELVADQDKSLTAFERARRGMVEGLAMLDANDDYEIRRRVRLATENSTLRARILENNLRTEDVIVEALELNGTSGLEARVVAGAILGAVTSALTEWAGRESPLHLRHYLTGALGMLPTVGADV